MNKNRIVATVIAFMTTIPLLAQAVGCGGIDSEADEDVDENDYALTGSSGSSGSSTSSGSGGFVSQHSCALPENGSSIAATKMRVEQVSNGAIVSETTLAPAQHRVLGTQLVANGTQRLVYTQAEDPNSPNTYKRCNGSLIFLPPPSPCSGSSSSPGVVGAATAELPSPPLQGVNLVTVNLGFAGQMTCVAINSVCPHQDKNDQINDPIGIALGTCAPGSLGCTSDGVRASGIKYVMKKLVSRVGGGSEYQIRTAARRGGAFTVLSDPEPGQWCRPD